MSRKVIAARVLILAWIVSEVGLASDDLDNSGAVFFVAPGQQVAGEVFLQSANVICIVTPNDLGDWVLDPYLGEDNCRTEILRVKSNKKWQVWVEDSEFDYVSEVSATPKTKGYMTEYDSRGDPSANPPLSPGYVSNPKRLQSPMNISATTEGITREVDLSLGGLLATGESTLDEPNGVKNLEVTFKQQISWGDAILMDQDHEYRMNITFTIISD